MNTTYKKIIDMISNGEEPPKRIRVTSDKDIYNWQNGDYEIGDEDIHASFSLKMLCEADIEVLEPKITEKEKAWILSLTEPSNDMIVCVEKYTNWKNQDILRVQMIHSELVFQDIDPVFLHGLEFGEEYTAEELGLYERMRRREGGENSVDDNQQ